MLLRNHLRICADPLAWPEIRHLPRFRQLYVCRIPGHCRLRPPRRPPIRRLGSGLREIRRLLFAAIGHGHWLPRLWTAPKFDGPSNDLLVQLASLSDLRGN